MRRRGQDLNLRRLSAVHALQACALDRAMRPLRASSDIITPHIRFDSRRLQAYPILVDCVQQTTNACVQEVRYDCFAPCLSPVSRPRAALTRDGCMRAGDPTRQARRRGDHSPGPSRKNRARRVDPVDVEDLPRAGSGGHRQELRGEDRRQGQDQRVQPGRSLSHQDHHGRPVRRPARHPVVLVRRAVGNGCHRPAGRTHRPGGRRLAERLPGGHLRQSVGHDAG